MNLLTLVQQVAIRCNYPAPAAAISSADGNISAMIAALQDTGDEMVERWGWQALKTNPPATFTGDGVTAAFPLPAGLQTLEPDLCLISSAYPTLIMPGPANEDTFLRVKLLPVSSVPSLWRVAQGKIEFFPVLAAGEIVSFIYQGGAWIGNSSGIPYNPPIWTADTDIPFISYRVLMLGGVWRFKYMKGFSYDEQKEDYEKCFDRKAGQEGTLRIIDMSNAWTGDIPAWPGVITDLTDPWY